MMGSVASLVSGKGGTGKTTLCAGIAAGLARLGTRVLCIDADVGLRNLDISLGMSDLAVLPFNEVFFRPEALHSAPEHPHIPGLFLLTAPMNLAPEDISPDDFQLLLSHAADQFDWVMVDAPAGIGPGFRMAVSGCDIALVTANAEPASLRDATKTAQVIESLGIHDMRLVVNRVRKKTLRRLGGTIDDAMDQVGLPLIGLVPEDPSLLSDIAVGKALWYYAEPGAVKACGNIAGRLMGKRVPLMKIR